MRVSGDVKTTAIEAESGKSSLRVDAWPKPVAVRGGSRCVKSFETLCSDSACRTRYMMEDIAYLAIECNSPLSRRSDYDHEHG